MKREEKELIEEKFKGVYLHQTTNFDLMNSQLDKILNQVTLTNGRVSSIEKQTKIIRFFESHPKITILVILGIFFITTIFDAKDIINFFK